MKKIKFLIPFILLFIMFFSFPVSAESSELIMCGEAFNVGDRIYYYGRLETYNTLGNVIGGEYCVYDAPATTSTYRVCIYLVDNTNTSSGKSFQIYNSLITGNRYNASDNSLMNTNWGLQGYCPDEYRYVSYNKCVEFKTNIPIFENKADADNYFNTGEGLNKAINYKKTYENGSWVRPFEDIEINDNDMLIPSLSNLSHNGFSISNRAEEYGVDVYVVSGLRQPGEFIHDVDLDLSDYLYGHTLGWLTNGDKVYTQDSFDLIKDFGVDNVTLLNESVNSFYTEYPNARAYYPDANFMTKVYYDVWGAPFGTTYFSYNDVTKVSASDLMGVDCYDVPLCFTCYKVRFYYYDENDGMHYGPWAVVTYCSNGDIKASTSYVGNDGSVIDTPTDFGKQDEQGNISYDNNNYSEFIDLGDVNGLFGNIRSIFNNISATNGTFSQLFASVFNFLPPEILAIIFGGIVLMVFIGIIKACIG